MAQSEVVTVNNNKTTKEQKMKNQYRHRAVFGVTRFSLRSFKRHLSKIGTPLYVRGLFAGKNPWYEVVIRGTQGSLVLRGLSWGYYGEGSRGTEEVLAALGVHPFDVQQVAFKAPNTDVPQRGCKQIWKLLLPASFAQLAEGEFVTRLTREQISQQQSALQNIS